MLLGRAAGRSEMRSWTPFILLFILVPPGTSSAVADLNAINAAEIFDDCCRGEDSGVYETSEFVFFLVQSEGIDVSAPELDLRLEATLKFFEVLEGYISEGREKSLAFSFSDLKIHILHQDRKKTRYLYHVAVAQDEIARLRAMRTGE